MGSNAIALTVRSYNILDREEVANICDREVPQMAARLSGIVQDHLAKFDDYEACANLGYHYEHDGQELIIQELQRVVAGTHPA